MKDDLKITYSFTSEGEHISFRNINEISNSKHVLTLQKRLCEFERKMKEVSAHYFLKEKLTPQQLEQIKIELKETESLPT